MKTLENLDNIESKIGWVRRPVKVEDLAKLYVHSPLLQILTKMLQGREIEGEVTEQDGSTLEIRLKDKTGRDIAYENQQRIREAIVQSDQLEETDVFKAFRLLGDENMLNKFSQKEKVN